MQNVMELTQINMLTTDRLGGIVLRRDRRSHGSLQWKRDYTYTGAMQTFRWIYDEAKDIATYTIGLKPGVHFSDGVEATAGRTSSLPIMSMADPSYVRGRSR